MRKGLEAMAGGFNGSMTAKIAAEMMGRNKKFHYGVVANKQGGSGAIIWQPPLH